MRGHRLGDLLGEQVVLAADAAAEDDHVRREERGDVDLHELTAGVGIGPMAANVVDGVRFNSAFAFLDPVRDSDSDSDRLTIAGGVTVARVLVEGGRTGGVVVLGADGREYEIRAERVVVAGGACGSPTSLLRSGIGPAADPRGHGIDVAADPPGVGAKLLDHPCVALDFAGSARFREALDSTAWIRTSRRSGARSSRCDEGPYDIHVFLVAGRTPATPACRRSRWNGGAMRARSQGRVTLRDARAGSLPLIDYRYLSDPDGHELQVLTEPATSSSGWRASVVRRVPGRPRHARDVRHPRPRRN